MRCQPPEPYRRRVLLASFESHDGLDFCLDNLTRSVANKTLNMQATKDFLKVLSGITGTGSFHSSGTAPFFFPELHLEGLGEIAFPLPTTQAKELVSIAESAPYGRGEETVFDDTVRKCWQIDASRLSFKSPQWKNFLQQTIHRLGEDLGIQSKISAHPYKLLLYGKGGHFKAHRDTEKLDAMFGTLIITLPSAHEGGRLLIRHDGRGIEVDFSHPEHRHEFQHAAFFADCEHEVEPVRSGYRCCLVYNLRLDEGDPGKLNLSLTDQARDLLPGLEKLKEERSGQLSAILLEHSYTEANFSLLRLKGHDQARAQALLAAAAEAGMDAHLALVTFHQMGELEDGYSYGRRRRYYDDDDDPGPDEGTMGEIYEESLTIEHWRDARNRRAQLGCYRITPDDLIASEAFGEGEPDEKEAEGFTGNAGCTMDYWYRRAAIVLWSKEDCERILSRYDFQGACQSLSKLATGKSTRPGSPFHKLGEAVIASYPNALPHCEQLSYLRRLENDPFVVTLSALAKAGAQDLLDNLLAAVPAPSFVLCDRPLWSKLYRAFGVETFESTFRDLLQTDAELARPTLFSALDALRTCKDGRSWARTIAAHLARLTPIEAPPSYGDQRRAPKPMGDQSEARILLAASHFLESKNDRQSARAFLEADSSLAYIREILIPVLLEKPIGKHLGHPASLVPEIFAFARDLLYDETTRPLVPYPDWRRPCPRPAKHAQQAIRELIAFMDDPEAESHHFARAQHERTMLESFIRQHFLDLDHVTIKKSRPHTLACTKNDRSYHQAVAQRTADEKQLAKLVKMQASG